MENNTGKIRKKKQIRLTHGEITKKNVGQNIMKIEIRKFKNIGITYDIFKNQEKSK